MCELTAYLVQGEEEELLMEDVASIRPEGEAVVLTDILGNEKRFEASIAEVKVMEHKLLLKS
jgi:predicted RNA-binding protein